MLLSTTQDVHSDSVGTTPTTVETDSARPFNVYTATIKHLSAHLSEGTLTSSEIVDTYLRQIEQWNPKLKALISVASRDQVIRLAEERDQERREGMVRGVMHGIPVVLK